MSSRLPEQRSRRRAAGAGSTRSSCATGSTRPPKSGSAATRSGPASRPASRRTSAPTACAAPATVAWRKTTSSTCLPRWPATSPASPTGSTPHPQPAADQATCVLCAPPPHDPANIANRVTALVLDGASSSAWSSLLPGTVSRPPKVPTWGELVIPPASCPGPAPGGMTVRAAGHGSLDARAHHDDRTGAGQRVGEAGT